MIRPPRFLCRFSLSLSLLGALAACDLEEAARSTTSEFRLGTEPGVRPSVSIRLDRGSVEILGSETDRVEAVIQKKARSIDPDAAQALLDRIEIATEQEGDRILIVDRSRRPETRGFGIELRADLIVRVPPGSDLDVRTGDGRIRIEGVQGRIVADTGDGRLLLERVQGNLTLRSADGSIIGRSLEGDVDARTEDGSIQISGTPRRLRASTSDGSIRVECGEGTAPSGEWVLHTADGSIALVLPPSISANLDATTSSGRIENELSSFRGSARNRRLAGRVGEGGSLIVLSTMDGHIELRDASF